MEAPINIKQNDSYLACIGQGITDRAMNTIKIVHCAIDCLKAVAETVVGIIATPFSAIMCNESKTLYDLADKTSAISRILPHIYHTGMKIINPSCRTGVAVSANSHDRGPLAGGFSKAARTESILLNECDHFLAKHVLAMAINGNALPIVATLRLADAALVVPAVAFSVMTLGLIPKVNQFASGQLYSIGHLLNDVSYHGRSFVNPPRYDYQF